MLLKAGFRRKNPESNEGTQKREKNVSNSHQNALSSFYKNGVKDVANSGRILKSRDRALISHQRTPSCVTHSHAVSAVHLTCNACLFVYLFQSFRGSLWINYIRPVFIKLMIHLLFMH